MPDRRRSLQHDIVLFASVLALVGFGIVMVYSASAVYATQKFGSADLLLQARSVCGARSASTAMAVAARTDFGVYRRWSYPLLVGSIGCSSRCCVVGARINGARRWFHFGGVSFQPAELAKLALVIYLAYSLAKKAEKVRSFTVGFVPHMIVCGLMMALLLKQPDLGTAVILGMTTLILLFVAGAKISYILLAFLGGGAGRVPGDRRHAVAPAPHARLPRSVAVPLRRRLPDHRVADLDRLGRPARARPRRRQAEALLPARGAHRLHHGHRRRGARAHRARAPSRRVRHRSCGAARARRCGRAMRSAATSASASPRCSALQALVNLGVVLGALPTKGLPLPFVSVRRLDAGRRSVRDGHPAQHLARARPSRPARAPAGRRGCRASAGPQEASGDRKLPGGGTGDRRDVTS